MFEVGECVIVRVCPIETPDTVQFREGRILDAAGKYTDHLDDPSHYRLVNIRTERKFSAKEPLLYKSHVGWVPITDIYKPK